MANIDFKEVVRTFGNKTYLCYKEYVEELNTGDPLSVVSVYCKMRFRDHIGMFTDSSIRDLVYSEFIKVCKCIAIDKDEVIGRLDTLDKETKLANPTEHFRILNDEINRIINSLRVLNNSVQSINNASELEKGLLGVASNLAGVITPEYNEDGALLNGFDVGQCNVQLTDKATEKPISFNSQFIISQYIGQREKNIGCYVGIDTNNRYYFIPIGTKVVIDYLASHNKDRTQLSAGTRYFNNLDDLLKGVANTIFTYAFYLDRTKSNTVGQHTK